MPTPTQEMDDEELSRSSSMMKPNNEVEERVCCECCGMSEECTPTYISRIREFYCGKWVCGLCSEAAQEKKRKYSLSSMEAALERHMALCKQFNTSIRPNPELSLATMMREFARKKKKLASAAAASSSSSSSSSYSTKLARSRTITCAPAPLAGLNK